MHIDRSLSTNNSESGLPLPNSLKISLVNHNFIGHLFGMISRQKDNFATILDLTFYSIVIELKAKENPTMV